MLFGMNGTEEEGNMAKMKLPEKIYKIINNEFYETDNIGMSLASVQIYKDKVLKIQEYNKESENEYQVMQYLYEKLPVPKIYAYEILDNKSYLLMSKCEGQMACSDEYMSSPERLCKLLASGLKKLWSVKISEDIPRQDLSQKLVQAEYNITHGLVDLDNTEPDTFGENGFKNPRELLQWLYQNRPKEELVLSHGDYCLPNIFGIQEQVSGYIDLGRTGIADKWCDIAICYRSLSHNYSGKYNKKIFEKYDDSLLFRELGIEPDWEKIRYYILLDELF